MLNLWYAIVHHKELPLLAIPVYGINNYLVDANLIFDWKKKRRVSDEACFMPLFFSFFCGPDPCICLLCFKKDHILCKKISISIYWISYFPLLGINHVKRIYIIESLYQDKLENRCNILVPRAACLWVLYLSV